MDVDGTPNLPLDLNEMNQSLTIIVTELDKLDRRGEKWLVIALDVIRCRYGQEGRHHESPGDGQTAATGHGVGSHFQRTQTGP
ncbi:hypothetical protein [Endozoicomonas sp.]|uniref:hypothetical protein n=1 Tax=Endozoicomonas sp. TaxID=1892382 RepID=UPI003AF664BF